MQELKISSDDGKNQYIEIAGKKLNFNVKMEKGYGAYDFIDMNPRALYGYTVEKYSITLGELKYNVEFDTDDLPQYYFKFYSEDLGNGKVEIFISYSVKRGGDIKDKMGIVDVLAE